VFSLTVIPYPIFARIEPASDIFHRQKWVRHCGFGSQCTLRSLTMTRPGNLKDLRGSSGLFENDL
jgi:hypothetical protein